MNEQRTLLRSDQVRRYVNTTAYWAGYANIVPDDGDVFIYKDGATITSGGTTVNIPRIKIGDGVTALGELPFTDSYVEHLAGQIADSLAAVAASGDYDDLTNQPVGGRGIEIKPLVPDEYSMITWAANESSTYIDTGIVPDVDDIEIELVVKPTLGSWYILQSRPSGGGATTTTGISGASSDNSITFYFCGVSVKSDISRATTSDFTIRAKAKNGNMSLYVKRHSNGNEDTKTGSYTYSASLLPMFLFGNQNNSKVTRGNYIYSVKIWKGGVLVMDYKPVMIKSNNNIAFFDTRTQSVKSPNEGSLYKATSDFIVETPIAIHCTVDANN